MKPLEFLATRRVFTRAELLAALAQEGPRSPETATSHLARWRRQGRVAQVKKGIYVTSGPLAEPGTVDLLLVASRLAPDGALAYHTALEAHGFARSTFERLQFVTATRVKPLRWRGRWFVPVRPNEAILRPRNRDRWIETIERSGHPVRVTSLERTVADALDRPDLTGGLEEAWRSCAAVPSLALRELEVYVRTLGRRTLAAKVGLLLERRREELVVPAALLDRLRGLAPRSPVYAEPGRPRGRRLAAGWNLLVPKELARGDWERAA
jgi:predicted transcriptional regulator of viral defense system